MKTNIKSFAGSALMVACSVAVAGLTAQYVSLKMQDRSENREAVGVAQQPSFAFPAALGSNLASQPVDLTVAAEKTVHAVVHIKSTQNGRTRVVQEMPDIFEYFFGNGQPRQRQIQSQPQVGYGSGVILSADGYIVTNNHVIENADQIDVTLNDNRTFVAQVIGKDANTDLALIKIEGDEFPFITMGSSDDLKLGEWVLAVGNPFNLTSTVTAGVVSAKARKIGIYGGNESIESFIQTDAAINMGNSGGALVNVRGELVGINAALESPTGTYTGYGFAIPTTIVRKVVSDLKEYGSVQRALLGIMGGDLSSIRQTDEYKDRDFGATSGVFISDVTDGGGAMAAGLQKEDVIISVDGKVLKTMTELQELLAQYSPGDKVSVVYLRDRKEKKVNVTLMNFKGNTDVVVDSGMEVLGATFQEVDENLRRQLNIGYGLQVASVGRGYMQRAGIQKSFIILKVNNKQIRSQSDLETVYQEAQKSAEQVMFISGIYTNGRRANYAVSLADE